MATEYANAELGPERDLAVIKYGTHPCIASRHSDSKRPKTSKVITKEERNSADAGHDPSEKRRGRHFGLVFGVHPDKISQALRKRCDA
jgi:hypothetical protein